jgi:hypothetical protein
MPSVKSVIVDGTDYAQESAGNVATNFGSVSNNIDIINDEWLGMRFRNIAVPRGAKILAVRLSVTINTSTLDEPFHNIYAQASDDGPVFVAGSGNFDLSTRPSTTAVALWDVADLGVGFVATRFVVSADLVPVIQEVVNRAGWVSGNAINILVTPAGADSTRDLVFTTTTASDPDNPGFAAVLDIEYELPGFISSRWEPAIFETR